MAHSLHRGNPDSFGATVATINWGWDGKVSGHLRINELSPRQITPGTVTRKSGLRRETSQKEASHVYRTNPHARLRVCPAHRDECHGDEPRAGPVLQQQRAEMLQVYDAVLPLTPYCPVV